MKVVYNNTYGGFELSKRALDRLYELKFGATPITQEIVFPRNVTYTFDDILRHDPQLVQVVEELGDAASKDPGELSIEEIEGDRYWIQEYDGMERVQTPPTIPWTIVETNLG